jgi:hypothetical protein
MKVIFHQMFLNLCYSIKIFSLFNYIKFRSDLRSFFNYVLYIYIYGFIWCLIRHLIKIMGLIFLKKKKIGGTMATLRNKLARHSNFTMLMHIK